jgi:hypothetical protein
MWVVEVRARSGSRQWRDRCEAVAFKPTSAMLLHKELSRINWEGNLLGPKFGPDVVIRSSCSGRKSNPGRPIVHAQKTKKMCGKSSLSDPYRRSLPVLIAWNLEDTVSSQQPNRTTDTSVSARSDFLRHTIATSRVLCGMQSEQKGQLR